MKEMAVLPDLCAMCPGERVRGLPLQYVKISAALHLMRQAEEKMGTRFALVVRPGPCFGVQPIVWLVESCFRIRPDVTYAQSMGRLLRGRDMAFAGSGDSGAGYPVDPVGFDDFHSSNCHFQSYLQLSGLEEARGPVNVSVPSMCQPQCKEKKVGNFHMAVHNHSLNGLPRGDDVKRIM